MAHKGSFLADVIMSEYREKEKWKRYYENQKKLKERNKVDKSKCNNTCLQSGKTNN